MSLAFVVLGLVTLAIFQNCAIHRADHSSNNCTNVGSDIEMVINGDTYYEDILAPSNALFRVSDPQASSDLKWFVTHINTKGNEIPMLRNLVSGSEFEHTFDSTKPGQYTIRAEEHTGENCYSYQKKLHLVTKIEAALGYTCPQGREAALITNNPPPVGNCHIGETFFQIGIMLKNEYSSSCTIEARSGSTVQTLGKVDCNTQNSILNLNIPNSPTGNKCKTAIFDITASNATESYTVYYKIDDTGFKVGTESAWCGGTTPTTPTNTRTSTTHNPGGETCYVMPGSNCYTPRGSNIYNMCNSRMEEKQVETRCSDEYTRCTTYHCPSAR